MAENELYYRDNLDVLRRHIPSDSLDPNYLDPPFNSDQNYNKAQVARHAGLRDVHGRDEVADGALAVVQDLDEAAARRVGEDGEDIGGHRTVYAWWCIYTLANVDLPTLGGHGPMGPAG